MGDGLFQICLAPPYCLLCAPPVRTRHELGASMTAKGRSCEQTHITENEIRATIWKERGVYSLSYTMVRPEAFKNADPILL